MTRQEWYTQHECQHAHCPCGCDHPQPFLDGEDFLCGACWCIEQQRCLMIPCTPVTCQGQPATQTEDV